MGSAFSSADAAALHEAADKGDVARLRAAVEKLAGNAKALNSSNAKAEGSTALLITSEKGKVGCVKVLLAATGVDVNAANVMGTTALIAACAKGHADVVKELLAAPGINTNAVNKEGSTALWIAACEGHADCVKALLLQAQSSSSPSTKVDVNLESHYGLLNAKEKKAASKNKTPLFAAAANGRVDVVRLLLAQPEILVNKATWDGRTPLSATTLESIKTLLREKGAK